ncbi:hypothetical protein TWF694_004497 [Orbilia ellipsospora]|uniref:Protein kinase domain-containing protein n=1 Tax=Orbilia ellipsospora TaxID=2528407 RepID=A0AAV9WVL8_9PEZI
MSSFVFPSAITGEIGRPITGSIPSTRCQTDPSDVTSTGNEGFAPFIFHVAYLEAKLLKNTYEQSGFFKGRLGQEGFVARRSIGSGTSFVVDHAEIKQQGHENVCDEAVGDEELRYGGASSPIRAVAIKTVKERPSNPLRWSGILFEIRTLLHEPVRFHPNIVRLVDIVWGNSQTGSALPALVLEFAEFGTFLNLQQSVSEPLPFRIRQKLCYDVSRGLSILHACGIIHGDLKHENVLIFRNRCPYPGGQPFTAKLADFGGAVIATGQRDMFSLTMKTIPFDAPEVGKPLTSKALQKADIYSFGMMVWRCMMDCIDLLVPLGIRQHPGPYRLTNQEAKAVKMLKESDGILGFACESISSSAFPDKISLLIRSVFAYTLRQDPELRLLVEAQAFLRGMPAEDVPGYLSQVETANAEYLASTERILAGSLIIDIDNFGSRLGRFGDEYDPQNNMPGYRPYLARPFVEGFIFEPLKLKRILSWAQQVDIVDELKDIARKYGQHSKGNMPLQPVLASYFLFQAYLANFGPCLNPEEACQWLQLASREPEELDNNYRFMYHANAWSTRVFDTFRIKPTVSIHDQLNALYMGIARGHRTCIEDCVRIIPEIPNNTERLAALHSFSEAISFFRTYSGGVGMPHYVESSLRRPYNLSNLKELDNEIRNELGDKYYQSLRPQHDGLPRSTIPAEMESRSEFKPAFDTILVNQKGHGLLHMAAGLGNLEALTHLYKKYECSLDLENLSVLESPLVCACRSGHYECAKFLLGKGANPNGPESGQEAPLHWISSFEGPEMVSITRELLKNGADPEKTTRTMLPEVKNIHADWEGTFSISLTPLGRAVLLQNIEAVNVLLNVANADPAHIKIHDQNLRGDNSRSVSAIELACVLTLPDILGVLLEHADKRRAQDSTYIPYIYNEYEMLEAAHDMRHTKAFDPLSLQSRVIRCGPNYKDWLVRTMKCVHTRSRRMPHSVNLPDQSAFESALYREIILGNTDIVEALLDFGYEPHSLRSGKPFEAAVLVNSLDVFELLIRSGLILQTNQAWDLLGVSASRQRWSPPGTAIAERLLAAASSVEPPEFTSPSPFVIAVKNCYFDLADLLLSHHPSVDINVYYRWSTNNDNANTEAKSESNGEGLTILGYLLQNHTYDSLQSIKYLVERHTNALIQLEPYISKESGLTAVHAIALTDSSNWNNHLQISDQISQEILRAFPSTESLGASAINIRYGTPLTAGVYSLNEPVISHLLVLDYRNDLFTDVHFIGPHTSNDTQDTPILTNPISLALKMYSDAVSQLENAKDIIIRNFGRLFLLPFLTILQDLKNASTMVSSHRESQSCRTQSDPHNHELESAIADRVAKLFQRVDLETAVANLSPHDPESVEYRFPLIEDLSVSTDESYTDSGLEWEKYQPGPDRERGLYRYMLRQLRIGSIGKILRERKASLEAEKKKRLERVPTGATSGQNELEASLATT